MSYRTCVYIGHMYSIMHLEDLLLAKQTKPAKFCFFFLHQRFHTHLL